MKEEAQRFFDLQKESKNLTIGKKVEKAVFMAEPDKGYEFSYVALCDTKHLKRVLKVSSLEKKTKDLIKQALGAREMQNGTDDSQNEETPTAKHLKKVTKTPAFVDTDSDDKQGPAAKQPEIVDTDSDDEQEPAVKCIVMHSAEDE